MRLKFLNITIKNNILIIKTRKKKNLIYERSYINFEYDNFI